MKVWLVGFALQFLCITIVKLELLIETKLYIFFQLKQSFFNMMEKGSINYYVVGSPAPQ